jgi:hypothetical protein
MAKPVIKQAANGPPDREPSEGSGNYMKRLLKLGFTDELILEAVHRQFVGSKASKADVAYNKGKLKKDGGWAPGAPIARQDSPPSKMTKPIKGQIELPWDKPGTKVAATTIDSLRTIVIKKASPPVLSALLNMALDVIEKL